MASEETWLIVEARRDDGTPTMFRIRELDPLKHLDRIFVVEMPYESMDPSRLPNVAAYRRLADFDEQWLRPACTALGWELVASKTEDGSFFLYMYGSGDPDQMVAKLSPFDGGLGFYDDADPDWLEYGALRELLDQAKAIPEPAPQVEAPEVTAPVAKATPKATNGASTSKARTTKAPSRKPARARERKPALARKRTGAKKLGAKKLAAKKPAAKKHTATKLAAKKPAARKLATAKTSARAKPAAKRR